MATNTLSVPTNTSRGEVVRATGEGRLVDSLYLHTLTTTLHVLILLGLCIIDFWWHPNVQRNEQKLHNYFVIY